MTDNPLIVVTGQPRSGTSLIMRILDVSGVPVLADETNSYECSRTLTLPKHNDWVLDLAPGTAIKILFPQVMSLPLSGNYLMLWMVRNPREQAKSQRSVAGWGRGMVGQRARSIRRINRQIPKELKRLKATVHKVSFEALLQCRQETLDMLEEKIGIDLDFTPTVARDPKFSGLPLGALETA